MLPVRVSNQNEGFASSCSRADLAMYEEFLLTLSPVCLCLFIILQGLQPLILFLILRSGLNAVTLMKRSKPDWKVNRRYTNAWVWRNQSPNFLCTCVFLFYYFNGSLSSCLRGNSKRKKTRKSSENLSFFFRGGMLSFLCPVSMQIY